MGNIDAILAEMTTPEIKIIGTQIQPSSRPIITTITTDSDRRT